MKKLLVIVGPTGTGKSSLALQLAEKHNGEIVSADSRQIYTGMDIGTGKEIENTHIKIQKFKNRWVVNEIPIHLYDVITPDKTFSVAAYQQIAYEAINGIISRGKTPFLVGGTGLYIRAVVEGMKIPKIAPDLKLRAKLESRSLASLAAELEKVDPETADNIDKLNPRRIIRALEIYYISGESLSKLKGKYTIQYNTLKIGLTSERKYLYERVDNQVEEWFEQGFIEEVKSLFAKGNRENLTSMTSLGYRQVGMYLRGRISLDEAKQRIKWELHNYIRAQLTWFRKEPHISWFDISAEDFKKEISNLIDEWIK